jgi:hypothetical protein
MSVSIPMNPRVGSRLRDDATPILGSSHANFAVSNTTADGKSYKAQLVAVENPFVRVARTVSGVADARHGFEGTQGLTLQRERASLSRGRARLQSAQVLNPSN